MPYAKRQVTRTQQFNDITRADELLAIRGDFAERVINDARLALRFAQFRPDSKRRWDLEIINLGKKVRELPHKPVFI